MARAGRALVCSLALALAGTSAAQAKSSGASVQKSPDIEAVLNSLAYGYDVTCIINGHDVGLTGGKGESQREYAENSKDAANFAPGERGKYAPLHVGRNSVKIIYKRASAFSVGLEMSLERPGYPAPLFYVNLPVDNRNSGTFEGTFDIADTPPVGFKPLVFTTSNLATSGMLYIYQERGVDGYLSPLMNNGQGLGAMLEHGQSHVIIWFDGLLHPGANTLNVEYDTKGRPMHLYILGPKGASTHVLESARKTKASFIVQAPDHPRFKQ